jgi:DNA-binding CsgD family transcriptional regulator/tetratricopeptide (TPR) repeat protein
VPDGDGVEVSPGPVPRSLPAAIADRLAFLSTEARAVLRAAALLGVDFSVTELAVVLDRQLTELLAAIDESITAGVLHENGAQLAFRHPLIRAALYQGMPLALRCAWHRAAAKALASSGAAPERVARQLLPALDTPAGVAPPAEAGQSDDWLVGWLVETVAQLAARAPQVAIPRAGPDHHCSRNARLDLLACRLAEVLCRVGEVAEATQVATRALEGSTDPDLLVDLHATLTQCRAIDGRSTRSLAPLRQALAIPGLAARHRARLLVLTARVYRGLGQVDQAYRVATDALADAAADADPWATGWALAVLTMVHGMRGDVAGALPRFERALAVTDGEPALADLRLLLQINQANALGYLDQLSDALAAARRVRTAADRAGNLVRLGQAESLLVGLLFELGHWDEAIAEADTTDHLPGAARDPVVECCRHGTAATIRLHQGEPAGLDLAAAAASVGRLGDRVVYPAALATSLDLERSAAPRRALDTLLDALSRSAQEPAETAPLLADTVRLAMQLDDLTAAQTVTARAVALAASAASPYWQATAHHCQGLLDGDPDLLQAACHDYAAAGRPLPMAQAAAAAGAVLAPRGDTAGARARFAEAFAAFETLGARWDLARLQAEFRVHGIRRGPQVRHRRTDHGWDSLTPSEITIARLVAEGMTNPQIAVRLFLSRRTVQSHVSHILTKLGVHSRMEIAREATRRGSSPDTAEP